MSIEAQKEYQSFRSTQYWKNVASAVKARAAYKCQACNGPHNLHAHHRTYEHSGSELERLNDLVCPCAGIHKFAA